MEPRQEHEKKATKPRPEEKKPRRFRLIKLEERIAPAQGGVTSPGQGCISHFCITDRCRTFGCGL
jgi:hypothetical protein